MRKGVHFPAFWQLGRTVINPEKCVAYGLRQWGAQMYIILVLTSPHKQSHKFRKLQLHDGKASIRFDLESPREDNFLESYQAATVGSDWEVNLGGIEPRRPGDFLLLWHNLASPDLLHIPVS